jgi:hypothetical protein
MDNEPVVNIHMLSDADLLRYVADGMRPTPTEHSLISAKLYTIAERLTPTVYRSPLRLLQGGSGE